MDQAENLWQSFKGSVRQAFDSSYWGGRIDAWIMRTHVPPYDWVLPRDAEPWVPCQRCWRDWPCGHFLRAEKRQRQAGPWKRIR